MEHPLKAPPSSYLPGSPNARAPAPLTGANTWLRAVTIDKRQVKVTLLSLWGWCTATSLLISLMTTCALTLEPMPGCPPTCLLSAFPTSPAGATFIEVISVAAPDPGCLPYTVPHPHSCLELSRTTPTHLQRLLLQANLIEKANALHGVRCDPQPHPRLNQRRLRHPITTQAPMRKQGRAMVDPAQGTWCHTRATCLCLSKYGS